MAKSKDKKNMMVWYANLEGQIWISRRREKRKKWKAVGANQNSVDHTHRLRRKRTSGRIEWHGGTIVLTTRVNCMRRQNAVERLTRMSTILFYFNYILKYHIAFRIKWLLQKEIVKWQISLFSQALRILILKAI